MKTAEEKSCNNCHHHYQNGNRCNARPCREGSNWKSKDIPLSERRTAEGIMPNAETIWAVAHTINYDEFKDYLSPYLKELEKYTEK